jgi:uncharacterized membrane protein HdeD (DUF308 family)
MGMTRTMIRTWWLLVLCGALEAVISLLNFLMRDPNGSFILRRFAVESTVVLQGKLALAAGSCIIAVGFWQSMKGKSWLLALNGFALGTYGLIAVFWSRGRLAFLPVALLFVLMATSFGIFKLALAPALSVRRDKWLLGPAGVALIGFGLAFLALGFGWISLNGPGSYFLWSSAYFGLSAICMMGLGFRLNSLRTDIHRLASSGLSAS